jgi:hypothetical protein
MDLITHSNVQTSTTSLLQLNKGVKDSGEYFVVVSHGASHFFVSCTLLRVFLADDETSKSSIRPGNRQALAI